MRGNPFQVGFKTIKILTVYFRVTQISEIKTHIDEKHGTENLFVLHGKQDRTNVEVIDCTKHLRFYLFSKQC